MSFKGLNKRLSNLAQKLKFDQAGQTLEQTISNPSHKVDLNEFYLETVYE